MLGQDFVLKLKIAIVVHGRFHAFDLCRALIALGHDVFLFTNYSKSEAAKFGISIDRVRTWYSHGLVSRVVNRVGVQNNRFGLESILHQAFGRWAASRLSQESWDVIYSWSGISEAILSEPRLQGALRLLVRGSSHIREQSDLLREEELRTGVPQDRPSDWRIEEEEREYAMADIVVVLSSFSFESFRRKGFPESRLRLMISGTEVSRFRPDQKVIEERCKRILAGGPLEILGVGTFSFQKGAYDWLSLVNALNAEHFRIRFVGSVLKEASGIAVQLSRSMEFIPRQPHASLPKFYAQADLFVMPTIQDGFPAVLAQAAANGIPILTTSNGAGHDLVIDDRTGWVLPIRKPERFLEKLQWCHSHRKELAEMIQLTYRTFKPRDWSLVAKDFEEICIRELVRRSTSTNQSRPPSTSEKGGSTAIVVPGRFFAFDLARALKTRSRPAYVLTNYPRTVVKRFGLDTSWVRSFVIHGIMCRLLNASPFMSACEPGLHSWFGRWANQRLRGIKPKAIYAFSGVAEDIFSDPTWKNTSKFLLRASAHIEIQDSLLREEEARAGVPVERPSPWMKARELREYELADLVVVPSTFAYQTFIVRGFPAKKLRVLPLSADGRLFKASLEQIQTRCNRIRSGASLRVLTVSTFSFQKGALDLVSMAKQLRKEITFLHAGSVQPECSKLCESASDAITFLGKIPYQKLASIYASADLFLLPTIHDGYAVVLAEALAAGLPVLTTSHSAGTDLVQENLDGWVLPIRSPDQFIARLEWCQNHRMELVNMVQKIHDRGLSRTWSEVGQDFLGLDAAIKNEDLDSASV